VIEMRPPIVALVLLALGPATSAAQSAEDTEGRAWSLSATVAVYALPGEDDYAQPTFTADRGALHLETRYNYEALRTASVWAGYTMRGGHRVEWELAPMVGAVFGATDGIAPGYAASLSWWKLDGYIEGEYVFARTSVDSFAYHWSEVAVAPFDWLRAGMVTQRTRASAAAREVQRGPFVNATFKRIDAAAYVFTRGDAKPAFVLSIGGSF
jgi:hypothetical protein